MSLDFLILLVCAVLGLMAHGSRHQSWLAWLLRGLIGLCFAGELITALGWTAADRNGPWGLITLWGMSLATGLALFQPVRNGLSYLVTPVNQLVSGQVLIAVIKKAPVKVAFLADRIFVPSSMPHLIALWIYITAVGFLLGSIDPSSFHMPALPIPVPVPLDQLFSYNGLGLVLLAVCGVGIFITRKPQEVLTRLGLVKPTLSQVGIALLLIVGTFAFDALCATFTHGMEGGLAPKLSAYNAGTFTGGGGAPSAAILALATGLCAGIGEETLMRGAVQPVLGILPAGILHGLLHGQFSHAPVFIIQVAVWSTMFGIVRRYTNTTTTIMAHVGFNLTTTFLFAFNP